MEKNLFNKYGKVICVFLLAEVLGIVFCNLLGIGRISKLNFTVNISEKREFAKMFFDVLIDKTKIFVVLSVISASVFYKYIPPCLLQFLNIFIKLCDSFNFFADIFLLHNFRHP